MVRETHYTCVQCHLTFVKLNDYMSHLKQEHCVEVYRCVLCKQMQLFDNLSLLKEHFFHVHQSHKYDLFRCRMCINTNNSNNNVYHSVDELHVHVNAVHKRHGHVATALSASSSSPSSPIMAKLRSPVVVAGVNNNTPVSMSQIIGNSNNKCFKCVHCDSDFAQLSALNQHIQMLHPKMLSAASSNANGQQQQQQQQQQSPLLANGNANMFNCPHCRNTSFANRVQLERHMRIHTASIDLKCNICDRRFDSQQLLAAHKLTHGKTHVNNNGTNGQLAQQHQQQPQQQHTNGSLNG